MTSPFPTHPLEDNIGTLESISAFAHQEVSHLQILVTDEVTQQKVFKARVMACFPHVDSIGHDLETTKFHLTDLATSFMGVFVETSVATMYDGHLNFIS